MSRPPVLSDRWAAYLTEHRPRRSQMVAAWSTFCQQDRRTVTRWP